MNSPHISAPQPTLERGDSENWHRGLAEAVRDPDHLLDLLELDDRLREPAHRAASQFPLLVPHSYLARIERGNPHDPLLRQVLPLGAELQVHPGFSSDAVADAAAHRAPGLLQKYTGRALLITTGACAVHCRYCFRRDYPYGDEPRRIEEWQPALDTLEADSSIHEIILSGGDPLMLTDARLADLLNRLESIGHLRRLRIHTRLPIVLPQRVSVELLQMLTTLRLTPIMVLHANHAQELQHDCAQAVNRIVRSGITTLNQAVLLKGINDNVSAQLDLCERLVDLGVIPYYLHQLDRVSGAAHFEVDEELGRRMIDELRARLPGYAVPQYVREVPGAECKIPL